MPAQERQCWLCPSFEHWTSDAVGVVQDDGTVWIADRVCARVVDPDRVVDVTEATELNGAMS